MLHSLRFGNFYSFKDEIEVSFVMDGRASVNDKSAPSGAQPSIRLSKILAVIGANGAGKTNVIKPFAFLSYFLTRSVSNDPDDPTYVESHFADDENVTFFDLEFEIEKRLFRYSLNLDSDIVYSEALWEKTSRQWSYVFTRTLEENLKTYKFQQKGFGFDSKLARNSKRNCSVISYATQHDVKLARKISSYFKKFHTNINASGRNPSKGLHELMEGSAFYEKNEHYKDLMVDYLSRWDMGLTGVEIRHIKHLDDNGKEHELTIPIGIHTMDDKVYELPLMAESSGTQSAFILLSKMLPVLQEGGVMVYDELESDLHPHMLEGILEFFFNPRTNPHSAQIIFTTHSVELLNILQKCQIMLVEKQSCTSEAWKLSDMAGVRSDDNFYAKYMSGTYGAIPQI